MKESPRTLLEWATDDMLIGHMFDKDKQNGEDMLSIHSTSDILKFIKWIQLNS